MTMPGIDTRITVLRVMLQSLAAAEDAALKPRASLTLSDAGQLQARIQRIQRFALYFYMEMNR